MTPMRNAKLEMLAEQYGMDVQSMLERSFFDGVGPGICANPGCNFSTEVEPDCDDEWCPCCLEHSVKSNMVLGV